MNAEVVSQITKNDVVLGRGSQPLGNIGRTKFREIIQGRQQEYLNSTKRKDKELIARQVMSAVARHQGRFLQQIESPEEANQLGVPEGVEAWRLVDESTVLKKIKELLRVRESMASTGSPVEKGDDTTVKGTKAGGLTRQYSTTLRPRKKARSRLDTPWNPVAPEALQQDNLARQPPRMTAGAAASASTQPPRGNATFAEARDAGGSAALSFEGIPRATHQRGGAAILQQLAETAASRFPVTGESRNPMDTVGPLPGQVQRAEVQSLPVAPGLGTSPSNSLQQLTNDPALAALLSEIEEQRQAKRAAILRFAGGATDAPSSLFSPSSTSQWVAPRPAMEQQYDTKPPAVQIQEATQTQIAPDRDQELRNDSALAMAISQRAQQLRAALQSHAGQPYQATLADIATAQAEGDPRHQTTRPSDNLLSRMPPTQQFTEPMTDGRLFNDTGFLETARLAQILNRDRSTGAALDSLTGRHSSEPASLSAGNRQMISNTTQDQRRQAAGDLLNRLIEGGRSIHPIVADSSQPLIPNITDTSETRQSDVAAQNRFGSTLPHDASRQEDILSVLARHPELRTRLLAQSPQETTNTNEGASSLLSSLLSRYAGRNATRKEPPPSGPSPPFPKEAQLVSMAAAQPAAAFLHERHPEQTRTTGENCLWNSLDSTHSSEPTNLSLSLTELLSLLVLCWYGLPTWNPDSLGGSEQPNPSNKEKMNSWDDFALMTERASVEWCMGHPILRHFQQEVARANMISKAHRVQPRQLAQKTLSLFQKLLSVAVEKDKARKSRHGVEEFLLPSVEDEMRRWKDTLRVPLSYTASDYCESSSSSTTFIHLVSQLSVSSCRAIVKQVSCLSILARIVTQLGDDGAFRQHLHNVHLLRADDDDDDDTKNSLPSWWKSDLIHYDACIVQTLVRHGYPGVLKVPLPSPASSSDLASIARGDTRQGQERHKQLSGGKSISLEDRGGVTLELVQNRAEYLAGLLTGQESRTLLQDQLRKRCTGELEAIYHAEAGSG